MADHDAMVDAATENVAPQRPLCFVLMPFDRKRDDSGGRWIDFDVVYEQLIRPAVEAAGLAPLRADEEPTANPQRIIHKPMFERLSLCEFAVADLTLANANVFYELGVRHAVRPYSTVLIGATDNRAPFDLDLDRWLPYHLDRSGNLVDVEQARDGLTDALRASREAAVDSPVFQLVGGFPDIDRLKTDVFRDRVAYSDTWKKRLRKARESGLESVRAVEADLHPIEDVESGVLIDLLLSYRAVEGWKEMVSLAARLPQPLATTPLVREQLAMALNRIGEREEAADVLKKLIKERGPSSETHSLLGRVYKDQWSDALERGDTKGAKVWLKRAVTAYLAGFEADWRDAYPGINAVTLMEIQEPPDPRREQLIPVVSYAVERRLESEESDYWDHATRLELAVLANDAQGAGEALATALSKVRERWEPGSTANNLRVIREARERRGEAEPWHQEIETDLQNRARQMSGS